MVKKPPAKPVRKDFTDVTDHTTSSKTDVIALLDKVDFSPENVVEAAATNPKLYVEAIGYRLECMRNKSLYEMDYKRIQAETEIEVRKAAAENDEKVTESLVKSRVLLSKEVAQAERLKEQAEIFDSYSKLVVDAFWIRDSSLKICSSMMQREQGLGRALEAESERISDVKEKLRNKYPGNRDREE